MVIDSGGIFRAVQRVANTVGLTLREDDTCTQPVTDLRSGEVTVPSLSAYTEPKKLMLWLGYIYHEIGHHAPECKDMLSYLMDNKIDCSSLFGRLGNIIEDIRNERNGHGYYPGRDNALARTQAYHALEGAALIKDKGITDPDMKLFSEVLGLSYKYRGRTFQPQVMIGSSTYDEAVDSSHLDFLLPDIEAMETAEDVFDIVRKILDQSEDHDAKEEEEKATSGDGEGEGERRKEESKGEGGTDSISYEDLLAHDHEDNDYGDPSGKINIVYDHRKRNDWVPHPENKIVRPEGKATPNPRMVTLYNRGSKIGSQTKRLFQSRSQTLPSFRHKSGRLTARDLHRVISGDVDVFKRTQDQLDTKNTAIFLLTDASGSMCGSPYETTAAAAALMNEALQVISIPLMIASFTENRSHLVSTVIKDWTQRVSHDTILSRYTEEESALHMNADGDSVMWAYGELMRRSEDRKILIVLSDGEPCAARRGDAYTHLKKVIPEVSKRVECYGIGIMSYAVSHFYPEYTVLNDTSQLQQCLLNVIKTKIIR